MEATVLPCLLLLPGRGQWARKAWEQCRGGSLTKPAGCGRLGLAAPPVTTLLGMTVYPWGTCPLTSGQCVGPMGKRDLTESRGLWGATAQKRGGQTCMVASGWGGDSGAGGFP